LAGHHSTLVSVDTFPSSATDSLASYFPVSSSAVEVEGDHENSKICEFPGLLHRSNLNVFKDLAFGSRIAFAIARTTDAMTLRIHRSDEHNRVVLTLSGRIQADQIPELKALLSSADHNFVLDLKDVKLVDRDVVRFLVQSEAAGAKLRNCSVFIREWISRERNGIQDEEIAGQQL